MARGFATLRPGENTPPCATMQRTEPLNTPAFFIRLRAMCESCNKGSGYRFVFSALQAWSTTGEQAHHVWWLGEQVAGRLLADQRCFHCWAAAAWQHLFSAGTVLRHSVLSIASLPFRARGAVGRDRGELSEAPVFKIDGGQSFTLSDVRSSEVCHRASGSPIGTCVRQSESGTLSSVIHIPWLLPQLL